MDEDVGVSMGKRLMALWKQVAVRTQRLTRTLMSAMFCLLSLSTNHMVFIFGDFTYI